MPRKPKPSPPSSVLVPVLLKVSDFPDRAEIDFARECRRALAASALLDPTRRAAAMERLATVSIVQLERDRADERRLAVAADVGRDT